MPITIAYAINKMLGKKRKRLGLWDDFDSSTALFNVRHRLLKIGLLSMVVLLFFAGIFVLLSQNYEWYGFTGAAIGILPAEELISDAGARTELPEKAESAESASNSGNTPLLDEKSEVAGEVVEMPRPEEAEENLTGSSPQRETAALQPTVTVCGITLLACQKNSSWISHTNYCLGQSLTGLAGDCMHFNDTLAFTNISIDCQGFTIDGDDTGTDYGVVTTAGDSAIRVQNCNISDFAVGFRIISADNSSTWNTTYFSNTDRGVVVSGSDNVTSNNSLYVANTVYGIEFLSDSDGGFVMNNTFLQQNSSTTAAGMAITASGAGINYLNASFNNFSYNAEGILFSGSATNDNNNTLYLNLFFRNKVGSDGSGINIVGDSNRIIENFFFDNWNAVEIAAGANDNFFSGNHFNTSIQAAIQWPWDALDQTFNDNLVEGQRYYHCYNNDSFSLNHVLVTAQNISTLGGINMFGCDNLAFTNITVYGHLGGDNAASEGWGLAVANATNLSFSLSNFSNNNLGVVFGDPTNVLITSAVLNSSISHSYISDSVGGDGLQLRRSANNTFINTTIYNNTGDAIELTTSDNFTLRDSKLQYNRAHGMNSGGSSGAMIINNTFFAQNSSSTTAGIILTTGTLGATNYWNISYNNFSYNALGLQLTGGVNSIYHLLFRNFFLRNKVGAVGAGVSIAGGANADNSTFIDNDFLDNYRGIEMVSAVATGNFFLQNRFNDSQDAAFSFNDWNMMNHTFNDNLVNEYTYYHCFNNNTWVLSHIRMADENISNFGGVNIMACHNASLTNITVTNNRGGGTAITEGYGLTVFHSQNVTITLSNFSVNNLGVTFGDATSATSLVVNSSISHSYISDNVGDDGLKIIFGGNITIINTTFLNNLGDGVDIITSHNLTFRNSLFSNNSGNGITVSVSNGSVVFNSTFLVHNGSGDNGIFLANAVGGSSSFWNISHSNFSYNAHGVQIGAFTGTVSNYFFRNTFILNNATSTATTAGVLVGANNATFIENVFIDNARSVRFASSDPLNALFFRNNFRNLSGFVSGHVISANTTHRYNLSSGGNYWDNFDTPADGCDDTNSDGFCDAAFTRLNGSNDSLPYTSLIDFENYAPNVTQLVPTLNSVFNYSTTIEIAANVSDAMTSASVVLANVTLLSNGSTYTLTLANGTGNNKKFNISYTIPNSTGVYNVTFFANDTTERINNTERTNFTVRDLNPPNVTALRPANGSSFIAGDLVEIAANITEGLNPDQVSVVQANLSYPNGSVTQLSLSSAATSLIAGLKYNVSFTLPLAVAGTYNVTFFANDTRNNINNTGITNFTVSILAVAEAAAAADVASGSTGRGGSGAGSMATAPSVINVIEEVVAVGTEGEAVPAEEDFLTPEEVQEFGEVSVSGPITGRAVPGEPISGSITGWGVPGEQIFLIEQIGEPPITDRAVSILINKTLVLKKKREVKEITFILENNGPKKMRLFPRIFQTIDDPYFIITRKSLGYSDSLFSKIAGLAYSSKPVAGKLLEAEVLNPEQIILEPGQRLEKKIEVREGLAPAEELKIQFVTGETVIFEQELEITKKIFSGLAIDPRLEENMLDIYVFIAPPIPAEELEKYYEQQSLRLITGAAVLNRLFNGVPDDEYFLEINIIKKEDGKEDLGISRIITPLINSLFRTKTKFADLYGPYKLKEEQILIFAQQFAYNHLLYNGNYIIKTTIFKGSKVIIKNEFEITLG